MRIENYFRTLGGFVILKEISKLMEENKPNFFYIIPAPLIEEGNLTKAVLYGLLVSLCNEQGYCWASNRYLAQKLGRKDTSIISSYLTELENDGWIIRENEGDKRRIWIRINPKGVLENSKGVIGKFQGGSLENSKQSNINEYNNSSNKFGDIRDLYPTVDQIMKEKTKDKKKK